MNVQENNGRLVFDWLLAIHDQIWIDRQWPLVVRCLACSTMHKLILAHHELQAGEIAEAKKGRKYEAATTKANSKTR